MNVVWNYLRKTLDENARMAPCDLKGKLSLQLTGSYQFYEVQMLGITFLLARPYGDVKIPQIQVHFQKISETMGIPVALLLGNSELTRYKQKKLLEQRIAFLCEDEQMYLPFIGSHFGRIEERTRKIPEGKRFTPSMQMIFLEILYGKGTDITQETISEKLGLSAMTASRALERLTGLGLLSYTIQGRTGRKKVYSCQDKAAYYKKGCPYLINPVKNTLFVKAIPEDVAAYFSGLSALGMKTMLGEPDGPVFAVAPGAEKVLEAYRVPEEQGREEYLPEIQVMKYDVGIFARDGITDPVSAVYSIEEKDERIEIAIDEWMEEYEWYRG